MAFTCSKKAATFKPETAAASGGGSSSSSYTPSSRPILLAVSDDDDHELKIYRKPEVIIEDLMTPEDLAKIEEELSELSADKAALYREILDRRYFDYKETPQRVRFLPCPQDTLGREVVYIPAPPGAGKSVFLKSYARGYNHVYPDRQVYLISDKPSDPTLDGLKFITRVPIEKLKPEIVTKEVKTPSGRTKIIEEEVYEDWQQFANSLLLFDDIDSMAKGPERKGVLKLLEDVIKLGRQKEIGLAYTTHKALGGEWSKHISENAQRYVFFPGSGMSQISRFIKTYLPSHIGLIDLIAKAGIKLDDDGNAIRPSRWVSIVTTVPQHLLTEREIVSLK